MGFPPHPLLDIVSGNHCWRNPLPPTKQSSGCLKFFLIGCFLAIVLVITIFLGAVFLIKTKGLPLVGNFIESATEDVLNKMELDDEEKEGIREQVSRVTIRLASGEMSMADGRRLIETFEDGSFMTLIFLEGVSQGFLTGTELSEEEKNKASRNAQRVQRGIKEEKIPQTEIIQIWDGIPKNEQGTPIEDLTDQDWRDFLSSIEQVANKANIPDATYDLDLVSVIKDIVDDTLGETGNSSDP